MDRALIFVTLGFALLFFIAREGNRLTRERLYEIIIAIYTFSCCFVRLYLPVLKGDDEPCGTFGTSLSVWPDMIFMFLLVWIVAHEKLWRIRRPKLWLFFLFIGYAAYTMLNPYNIARRQSLVEVTYMLAFGAFIYLFANCFSVKSVVRGIYMGLAVTVILHFLLAICYPVLGMENVVKLFDNEAATRSEERIGAVGTMSHPNALGAYASYYFCFFVGCFITAFKRRESAVFAGMAFIVIILSASRSALLAAVIAMVGIVVFYVYRRYKLLSFQNIMKAVIPLGAFAALMLTGPLSFLFSDLEDLDEMTTSRLMHYYCGYEIFQDHPLIGVGMNAHLVYLFENSSAVMFEQVFDATDIWQPEEFMFNNPIHNIWIIFIVELGLIGFLPILGFVIWHIATFKRRTRYSRNRYYNILNISGLGVIFCWLIHGNSDYAPLTPQVLELSLFLIALSLIKAYATEEHPEFESVEATLKQPPVNDDNGDSEITPVEPKAQSEE
jgi:O-antigen ligase